MAPAPQQGQARPRRWGPLAALITRPRLLLAIGLGAAVGLCLWLIPNDLRLSTRAILAWDTGAGAFVAMMMHTMRCCPPEKLRGRAAAQDEGQHFILSLVLVAAIASIGAIAAELSLAKNAHGLEKAVRIALAFGTVTLSWFLVQLIFALHYAHEFYQPEAPERDEDGDGVVGGLNFPGSEDPDYWDFVHFAVVIGVASQTADISFTSKPLRRIGTVQGVIAFTFNTVVLALTVNLVAGLF